MTHTARHVTLVRPSLLRTTALACSVALASPVAEAQDIRVWTPQGGERRIVIAGADRDRHMIGVATASGSDRGDTLGLRVESVTPGSPAEKAGLKAGDRLQSVNGISLRADRADAGEADFAGVLMRRLQRAVQETKPGEAVSLRVRSGDATRELKVVPVKASELEPEREEGLLRRMPGSDRAVLGLTVAGTGTARDTLGVFVQAVTKDGPAERAGIVEGDRIAAINGVSLRVAREDAEDELMGSVRAERLAREVAKLEAGQAAELTVVTAGRSRTVRVTAVKASELPGGGMGSFLRMPEVEGLRRLERLPGMPGGVLMLRDRDGGAPRVEEDVRVIVPELRRRPEAAAPRRAPLIVRRSIRTEV